MTSELRHPVYVWRDACIAYGGLSIEGTDAEYKAAAVIEAYGDEREAKYKALAETLAGALETAASCLSQCAEGLATQNDMETWAADVAEALRQYKEARDV